MEWYIVVTATILATTIHRVIIARYQTKLKALLAGGVLLAKIPAGKNVLYVTDKKLAYAREGPFDLPRVFFVFDYADLNSITFIKSSWSQLDPVKVVLQPREGKEVKLELSPNEAEKLHHTVKLLGAKIIEKTY